jgi:apolipoprotein D and lipocalin family protein
MSKRTQTLLLAIGVISLVKLARAAKNAPPLHVVPSVDLKRYSGKWYEIARLPNRFQRRCAGDTTATYTVRPDGRVAVLNQCRGADGRVRMARGTARPGDPKGPNTKLKVTFFWPFTGNYWILDLDPDYRWAVVGEPDRDYAWILCREPRLDLAVYDRIVERLRSQGFAVERLTKTPQS